VRALAAVLVALPAIAQADSSVTVTLTPFGEQLAMGLGDSVDGLIQKVHDTIDDIYQTARIGPLLDAFMTTSAFANRSLGVDYEIRTNEVELGSVFTGTRPSDETFVTGHVVAGTILNVGILAGANLAALDHPRWSVFANGFYQAGSLRGLDGHLLSAAAHAQVKLVPASAPGLARWIGVDVTSGLELARWTLGNSAPIVTHFTIHGSNTSSRNLQLASTGTLSLVSTTVTLPIEVTTGVRLLDVIGLYAGAGLDLTAGGSTIAAALDGDLTVTQDGTQVGHVTIVASGDETASPVTVHALGGIQVDAVHFHIFAQGVVAPDVRGLSFGVRLSL
jgi:hypothetical protein